MTTASNELEKALSSCSQAFLGVGVFSLFVNLLQLTIPIYMLQVFDRVITTRSIDTLVMLTVMASVAMAVGSLLEVFRSQVLARTGLWLNERMSGRLLGASVAIVHRGGTASAQALRDFGTVRSFLTGPSLLPLLDAPWAPIFIGVIFILHPVLGWIAVFGGVLLLSFALVNDLAIRGLLFKANQMGAQAFHAADLAIRNAPVLTAMGMTPNLIDHWGRSNSESEQLQAKARSRANLISTLAKLVRLGLQVAIMGAAAYLTILQEVTPGAMIAASIILGRAMAPVEQSITVWKTLVDARAAYRRIQLLLRHSPNRDDEITLPTPTGKLSVEGVTYLPPGLKEPLLKNVSFALNPGESLGLIGPSGAGKTQLAYQIMGIHVPSSGHVRLDGASLSSWNPDARGQYIGYLPQDVELFTGTVRENISRLAEASSEEVIAAAQVAGVHELILRLPEGYDTRIGEGGVPLSGGQRQRVGLARAVFGGPKLILLDEPNANLDSSGEQALEGAMERLRRKKTTVILITQRPNILRRVDKVLVIKEGAVELFGPREQALAAMSGAVAKVQGRPQPAAARVGQQGHPQPARVGQQGHPQPVQVGQQGHPQPVQVGQQIQGHPPQAPQTAPVVTNPPFPAVALPKVSIQRKL